MGGVVEWWSGGWNLIYDAMVALPAPKNHHPDRDGKATMDTLWQCIGQLLFVASNSNQDTLPSMPLLWSCPHTLS